MPNVDGSSHQLWDNFWADPNFTFTNGVTHASSGQAWTWSGQVQPTVTNGAYIQSGASGTTASYLFGSLGADCGYMEAQAQFGTSGSTSNGGFTLVIWQTTNITQSPCHLVCLNNQYQYSVINAGGFVSVQTVFYASTINLQYVKVLLDKVNSVAHVTGADGITTAISHASIGAISGNFPGPEIQYPNSATDNRVSVLEFATDSVGFTPPVGGHVNVGATQAAAVYVGATPGPARVSRLNADHLTWGAP